MKNMKFSIRTPRHRAPRLGVLKIENKPDLEMETPLVLLHTQGGHIPHVTHEVFKLVSTEPQILQIPLVSMHCFQETSQYYNGTISEFIGSKNSLTCLTLQDPSNLTKQGHHIKDKIPIWTKQGKVLYDSEMYMNIVESFKPDMYYLLSDGDTNMTSSQKRVSKAVENTITFSKQCLERHRKSDILKDMFVMAPIAGGYCLNSREKCIKAIMKDQDVLDGFLIDGLHNNGPEVEFLPFNELKPVVSYVIDKLPPEKLVSVQGCWNPLNVLKLVQEGVDVFDTSYCRILTERSAALTFSIDGDEESDSYEMNLRQSKFAEDFDPIIATCECLACKKYSRGYIHHLLTVQELLAPVLLMIHNIHHYLRFFKKIRECIANDTLSELEYRISEQYKSHQDKVISRKADDEVLHGFRNNAGDIEV
ncbi:queuine tRNA-ribosyltransferase accessory subunit 2 [Leptinotarsa decemlineata]|uniref:queuine tRNA-ribosyltransferase accessory subunit 2 n=1 Tax=Leptinotarsa decemlineata TaxID=7539 RepID=UPI003D30516A